MATTATPIAKQVAGGSFLIENRTPQEVFTPEDFSEEQRQIADTASQFAANEVLPVADQLEAKAERDVEIRADPRVLGELERGDVA